MKLALLLLALSTAQAQLPAVLTTYAAKYGEHPNRRYSPDSLNVATGWRYLYGRTLWISHGEIRVRVTAKDVMAPRFDSCRTLHLDASPRVMRALGLRGRAIVKVWIDNAR